MRSLDRRAITPIDDPLTAFAELAGEIRHYATWMGDQAERLQELTTHGPAGEQVRAILAAYGDSLDRMRRVLADYGRLDIDSRLARVTEQQAEQVIRVVTAAIERVGFTEAHHQAALRGYLARLLGRDASGDPELDARLDEIRAAVTAPNRVADLERELAIVREERDRLSVALRDRGPGMLAIEAAPSRRDPVVTVAPDGSVTVDAGEDATEVEFVAQTPPEPRESRRGASFRPSPSWRIEVDGA